MGAQVECVPAGILIRSLRSVPSVESAMTDGHNGSLDTTTEGDSRSRIFREIDFAEQKFRTPKAWC